MGFIQDLQAKKTIELTDINGVQSFVLTNKKSISITKAIQQEIVKRYPVGSEIGGVISMKVVDNSLISSKVYFFDNTQTDTSKYSPDYNQYNAAIDEVFRNKELPFFFHTHPTKLGIKTYDYKAANFYLTSSLQDRDASFSPTNYGGTDVVMPNIIFVSDVRFEGGLGVGMYGGNIFPLSFNRLGNVEIIALELLSIIAFIYLLKKDLQPFKWLGIVFAVVVGYYFYNKPKYNHLANGDILITV